MNSRVKRIKLSAAITDDDQTAAMMEICFNNDNGDVENVNDIDLPLIEKHTHRLIDRHAHDTGDVASGRSAGDFGGFFGRLGG